MLLRAPVRLVLFALALLVVAGCGITQNPAAFPYNLFSTGDIIPTHAKPPGKGYFANFDPHACKLVVRPLESTSPVRTAQVLIATVYDDKGQPRRSRRVEWMLEGAGNIVEVDESGLFAGRGYKVDNKYAVSYTDYHEHTFDRGTPDPNDDFTIRPGQTWCVITSAVEGDTHVTAYAPEIHNWPSSRVYITQHWVDARWDIPAPVARPTGTQHVLTTKITRHTDGRPLTGYKVRYRLLEPGAVLLPAQSTEVVATTDLSGNASAAVVQTKPGPGKSRVAIEIIRAPDPTTTSGAGIVLGRSETSIDWLAPSVALDVQGPATAVIGKEAGYTILVSNPGQLPVKTLTVRQFVPDGVKHVRSDPPAIVEGDQLIWTLGELAPGASRPLQVVLQPSRPERIISRVTVVSEEGLRDEKTAATVVTQPGLKVAVTGPASASPNVPLVHQITVTNPGTGPASNVLLKATFDAGLETEAGPNPVELRLDAPLEAGQSRTILLTLFARRTGNLKISVTASADGATADTGQHVVAIQEAKVTINLTGPTVRYLGRPAIWDLLVTNAGQVPLTNVIVRDLLPPELEFAGATDNGQLNGR